MHTETVFVEIVSVLIHWPTFHQQHAAGYLRSAPPPEVGTTVSVLSTSPEYLPKPPLEIGELTALTERDVTGRVAQDPVYP